MAEVSSKKFNLPWHQHDSYWLTLYAVQGKFRPELFAELQKAGLQELPDNGIALTQGMGVQASRTWKTLWTPVYEALSRMKAENEVEVALTPGAEVPGELVVQRQSASAMQAIAESLWLGEALLEERIMCYLQPVLSAPGKVFGYESFARVAAPDGAIIAGDRIVTASKALGIEYMIDRHLQVQAIKTFMSSKFNGFLFVNFFPGFIHRPAVYLEGLSDTVKSFGIVAKNIVLDFTKSETPHDLAHLKSVCEYGRSCGYSIALDDVESVKSVKRLLTDIRPDFVKIDMQLVHKVAQPEGRDTIREIVELAHASKSTVVGEGVETEAMHQALRQLGVDLFQGYHFSPPVPVEVALKRTAN
jgi:EAL domain-containing protein (putative c-di-GMP-specific phosphodiesterase class I)